MYFILPTILGGWFQIPTLQMRKLGSEWLGKLPDASWQESGKARTHPGSSDDEARPGPPPLEQQAQVSLPAPLI